MNCTDVCDALIRKLKEAGYTIRDKEAHEDALKALAESKIVINRGREDEER